MSAQKATGFIMTIRRLQGRARWAWYVLRVGRILLRHATGALEEVMQLGVDGWRPDQGDTTE